MTTLQDWLAQRTPSQLQEILARRPDVQVDLEVGGAEALATALQHPVSLRALAEQLSLPELQVLEVVVALGARATPEAISALLEDSGDGHHESVVQLLQDLTGTGVVWPEPDGRVTTVRTTPPLFPAPLGTSGTLADLVDPLTVTQLREMLAAQGHPRSVNPREELASTLMATLSDPGWVRDQVTSAESDICEPLLALAKGADAPAEASDFVDGDYADQPYSTSWRQPRTRHEVFQGQSEAIRWASELGIVIGARWGYEWRMPSEVALALRGSAYRAPFTPHPPPSLAATADPEDVRAAMAAAVVDFSQQATAVLDMVSRYSWPMAKSGGLAVRVVAQLAKAAVVPPAVARLALELADQADLLVKNGGCLGVSFAFSAWRAADPRVRYAALLKGWWWMPFAPTSTSSGRRKAIRPPERASLCLPSDGARLALIPLLASLPPGHATSLATLLETLRWQRPRLSTIAGYQPEPWSIAWSEAESLGIIAAGVLTPIGRALPKDESELVDTDALAAAVTGVMPPSSERVLLGSDLTATVIGLPTARVTLLLDSIACRERGGSAVGWRFSESSVRAALDDGSDLATLIAHLESLAGSALPQPLLRLLRDVDRRHGELRLSDHGTLLRSEDPILMTQVVHDRSQHRLGLRVLAPTIVTSRLPVQESLAALRQAGYYPIPEGDPAEWIDLSWTG
jgi:Helicase conserved C-terminal domain